VVLWTPFVHSIFVSTRFGRPIYVDRHPPTEHELLTRAMAAGEALGIRWEFIAADNVLRATYGQQQVLYRVEVKPRLRRETLGVVLHQLKELGENALLVTEYVAPALAETLRERGVAFIDTAGNAHLVTPHLLVWVKGQRPAVLLEAVAPTGRAFTATGLQVLFVLLCHPEWIDRPYRAIAEDAGVAHGTVGWVMAELPTLGFAAKINGKRRLIQGAQLLRQWVEAYARTLRPKLVLARYHADTLDWVTPEQARHYDLQLGGEPAGATLTQHLRPATATFYGAKPAPRMILDQRLRADPNGNVELLRRFWTFKDEPPGLVPELLVYADLLALGDARCLETAELLHERIVDRFNGQA
jgi:hypothetical protein